jgi:hypothetical protein
MTDTSGEAVIEDGHIVIRFRIDALPTAVAGAAALGTLDAPFKVTNAEAFAKDLVSQLNEEDEQGTTMIHRMMDEAFNQAADQGAFGTSISDDDED